QVSFESESSPGTFLRAKNGSVSIALYVHLLPYDPAYGDWVNGWIRVKNEDRSWSFMSHTGGLLSASKNGTVYLAHEDNNNSTHFWLDLYEGSNVVPIDLSASNEIAGIRCVKIDDKFLHLRQQELPYFDVELGEQCIECDQWNIVDHFGQVALKHYCSNNTLFLSKNQAIRFVHEVDLWR
ncbi:hypothetical protein PMAYCL1PPCAC_21499, partial [Pristionchus mayeri]